MATENIAVETKSLRSGFRWVVAGLIFAIYTVAAADRANFGVALPFIRREFVMTNTQAGALSSIFLLAYAIAQLPAGFAIGKFGVRKLITISMIGTSLATGFVGAAASLFALKVSRFALGIAEGPLPICISSTINNWFPAREKGTASGIFLSAVKFGPVVVPPLCAIILSVWGWREIFYAFAAPGVLLALIWLVYVKNHPSESTRVNAEELAYITGNEGAGRPSLQRAEIKASRLDLFIRAREVELLDSNRAIFGSWSIWGCALGYGFQLGISNVLLAWIPTYLISVKHFSVAGMGVVAATPWIGAVAGNIVGGFVSDRFLGGRRKPGMLLSALSTAVMMLALISSPASPLAYGGLLFLTGALLSFGYSGYMVYPMGLASQRTFPVASSIVNMGGQLGGAAAPFLAGVLLDTHGWNYVFAFMAISSILSLVVVATIVEPLRGLSPQGD
ncbi:MFS transporter [Paraburkholderia sp. EG287A]|uniref:MFS transporter n=1 Tax=unclassified Paraburkholderia TaxID=2615204 RepID=UPI0034D220C3